MLAHCHLPADVRRGRGAGKPMSPRPAGLSLGDPVEDFALARGQAESLLQGLHTGGVARFAQHHQPAVVDGAALKAHTSCRSDDRRSG